MGTQTTGWAIIACLIIFTIHHDTKKRFADQLKYKTAGMLINAKHGGSKQVKRNGKTITVGKKSGVQIPAIKKPQQRKKQPMTATQVAVAAFLFAGFLIFATGGAA